MEDKFGRELQVGDHIMYVAYGPEWRLGIVARVTAKSIRCFEGTYIYSKGTANAHTSSLWHDKRSSNQLLVLSNEQVSNAINNKEYPYVRTDRTNPKDYNTFIEEFEKFKKTL